MDKNEKKDGIKFNDEINEDVIDIKEEKDLIKALPSSEISPIIIIKDLIISLKEKITVYENQIKKLIDDKVKLQMDMNAIILQNLQSKKKNNNSINNINSENNVNNKENSIDINNFDYNKNIEKEQNKIIISSLIDINQKLIQQNKELKEQLDQFKNNLDIYKQKINEFKNNKNNNKCEFCEEKKLELIKMSEEKKEIYSSINSLRKQMDEIKLSEKLKKEKKKKREKIKNSESLPNIEQYFILNNKFQLVDSDKNLWHMKKCLKFQEFKKKFEGSNFSSDDILKEFVNLYDSKMEEEKSDESGYLEALNISDNEVERKKNENKYLPPLPGMSSNLKKKGMIKNNEDDNVNNVQEINNSDIHINIDENEDNKKDGEDNKVIIKEEKKVQNNDINENAIGHLSSNMNEIKEETSFNLSDNTD